MAILIQDVWTNLSSIYGNAVAPRGYPASPRAPGPLRALRMAESRMLAATLERAKPMPVLHQMQMSGNCYKVRLTAKQAGVPLTLKEYPLLAGETRRPEFLAKNPNGRVPLIEWEDGRTLPESNAIIWHLAEGSPLAPDDSWSRAEALSWMFFEQYSHEPYIAVARFFLSEAPEEERKKRAHLVSEWHVKGNAALAVMETHLRKRDWFAGAHYSVADIALFGYTHCADEGGFALATYPAILRWIDRVREQPGHVPLSQHW